ncbi:MAG: hypothetical protein VR64_02755 [Desulfatitalea sp. BRH_c12]|nr:MAG: hypothetical protein VR64_02755 [Desulfatitalea sp. BRH_c12]
MIAIDGYTVTQRLKQDRLVQLYEATDITELRQVLMVYQSTEGLPPEAVGEIFKHFKKIRSIHSDNLLQIHHCLKVRLPDREDVVFICDIHQARPLKEQPRALKTDILRFLDAAISLVETVNQLHQKGIFLKQINPTTLLARHHTGTLMVNTPLILSAATHPLSGRAVSELYNEEFLAYVLPYISPEQSGRMNRQVDYRSDFYAIGVLFYEMLTGRTPFSSSDPLELIHAHIARQPLSPNKIRMDIPDMLSRISLKLLEKMPEDRYQSAFGLLSDLRRCYQEFCEHTFIPSFALGNRDAPEKLQLSKDLFGREKELSQLLSIFEKVKAGSTEIFNITGPPGIGKTRLAEELQLAVVEAGGYFGFGKHDPFHRNTPYSALIEAFRLVVRKILGESPERLAYWKERLLSVLGWRVNLIIDFIPELECVVGAQPPAPAMNPEKSEKRFLGSCVDFLRVFALQEHPLVIFLDDMQWIDSASLALIEHVVTATPYAQVMFMGAYRDNEVPPAHPFSCLVERVSKKGVPVGSMAIAPLEVKHIRQAIIAALSKNVTEIQRLAEIIFLKTHGNPFFVHQFIQSLYLRKLLYFDFQTGVWRWDEQGIRAQAFTDNVIALMNAELQNLPADTLTVMKIAACIGRRFDFLLLAAVNASSVRDTAATLLNAVDTGYITAKGESYHLLNRLLTDDLSATGKEVFDHLGPESVNCFEFLHDRVHQSVYDLLPIHSRRPLHLKIGQLLLKQVEPAKLHENIFNVVNQLNHGGDFIIGSRRKSEFARLYIAAGKKAKEGAAYLLATNYFNTGIALLTDHCWTEDYDLAFGLYKEKLECAFMARHYDEAERLFGFVVERTRSALDKAALLNFRLIMYASSGRHADAVAVGLEALKLLGQDFAMHARPRTMRLHFFMLRMRLTRRRLTLEALPEIKDPQRILIMKLLMDVSFSIYIIYPSVYVRVIFRILTLTLKFGNSPAAFFGYAIYGALCCRYGHYELGKQLGDLALHAQERFGHSEASAKILLYYGIANSFWSHHVSFGLHCSRQGLEFAMENGDFNFAAYHIQSILVFQLVSGTHLADIDAECKKYDDYLKQFHDLGSIHCVASLWQVIRCLRGKADTETRLDDELFSEPAHLECMAREDTKFVLLRHYQLKMQLLYTMNDYEGALEMSSRSAKIIVHNAGTIVITEFYFYRCLAMLALYLSAPLPKRRFFRRKIRYYVRKMAQMAEHCPANFRHKYFILLGEKARVEGNWDEAFACFKQGLDAALKDGFIHMAAIANELSAHLALKKGHIALAKAHLQDSRACYLKWGAAAKGRQMTHNYPQLFHEGLALSPLPASREIDYATVVSALQTISTEIVLDRLLKRLMTIVVENAGAQRVLFLLKRNDSLEIKASSGLGGPIRITQQAMPVHNRDDLLLSGIHYVQHTLKSVVIDDAQTHSEYRSDPYVQQHKPKSIFCLPIVRQADLVALLYLENNLVAGVFTPDRIEILQLIASQAAISIENAKLYENVRQKERDLIVLSEKLRSLSSELLLTEERERRRIAVELHDRIGHALANVKMQLGGLKETLLSDDGLEKADKIAELVDQSIQDTQSLTFDLSPPVLYDLGLEAAIEWLVDQMQEQYRMSITFIDQQQSDQVDESVRVLAFQATRELLFNIVKHAHAHHAWVSIKQRNDHIHIEIKDDGVGMQASMKAGSHRRKTGGFGLFSIQERLKHIGGRLAILSEPGHGTHMTLIAPMHLNQRSGHEHSHINR